MLKNKGMNDKIYFINFVAVWTFTVACFLLTLFSGKLGISDMSVMNTGMNCAWLELSVHTGFFVWKCKVENCRKFKDVNRLEELEREV